IPMLNDSQLEAVLEAAAGAGAREAAYVMLRLPLEVAELFQAWLEEHFPERAARVMNRVRDLRGGRDNDPRFGHRMRGEGVYADLLRQRFARACRRLGLNRDRIHLDCSRFAPPVRPGQQLELL
ncbi:MAG: radical SAM protein, partial [Gammaproteobacteria bacterium]